MAGRATKVSVWIGPEGQVRVADDGGGIPTDTHSATGVSAVETVMTTLHAGGKFGGKAYAVSSGLHGVGVSAVNALSSHFEVEIYRDGRYYQQEFAAGQGLSELKSEKMDPAANGRTGTTVCYTPDAEIFPEIVYDFGVLSQRFKEMAYLNKGLEIHFRSDWHASRRPDDEEGKYERTYRSDGGISEFVTDLNTNRVPLHKDPIYAERQVNGTKVEAAMQYNDTFNEAVYSFANCVNTAEGGSHLTGFRAAVTRVVNDYGRKQGLIKAGDPNLSGEATREGLAAAISVKLTDPQFEGQTKEKLGNPEVRNHVETVVAETLQIFLEDNPQDSRRIIDKCTTAQRARDAARKARELIIRKNAMDGGSLPGLLADCSDRNPENCELYIVEGPSAGGTAKMGRNRTFQAVLPLKGKILNVEKAREDKMIGNAEIRALIIALGAGIGEDFNLEKLRYHRIVIMTDADVDGSHIRTLLLTFFYRNMNPLITNGHLYIAQPPLYGITAGKSKFWAADEEEREAVMQKLSARKSVNVQRYKGLGEYERHAALGDDHGPRAADSSQGRSARRGRCGQHLRAAHGRRCRAEAQLHPGTRARSREYRRLGNLCTAVFAANGTPAQPSLPRRETFA